MPGVSLKSERLTHVSVRPVAIYPRCRFEPRGNKKPLVSVVEQRLEMTRLAKAGKRKSRGLETPAAGYKKLSS
jgi:hypothetical protein